MRLLTLALAATLALAIVPSVQAAEPVAAAPTGVALCVLGVYNNQQGQPSSGCDGIVCQGFSDGDWHTCVLDCTTCTAGPLDADGQAAVCVYGDVYNTGSIRCPAVVCYGQTQYAWQTCVGRVCLPPQCHIPPPATTATAAAPDANVAICVYGDAYNTGGSRCEGAVCLGWTMGRWVDCYPRIPPCSITCPPPPPATRLALAFA